MSNYAAKTLGQPGITDPMVRACHRLQKVTESVPTYVIYGGPGEMWPNVVRCGGQDCFDTKAHYIRELLASSGHIKVNSGKDDFRAFFDISDLDDIGHIRGLARDKAIQWMTKQASYGCLTASLPREAPGQVPECAAWLGATKRPGGNKICNDWSPTFASSGN